ncbi:signal peptide peptidase SppA [Zoogloea sp.]|uniref:signal peptide peptidase SppA n=1 Tax=Zoogloea sp. TaxID=49181 RepID=UPI002603A1B1|nr:signal peptide peptidase SppA [Zoogloea sp.]MDD3352986.1 signal peptide peptidase SppA [Zoogloea sp.]
MDRNARPGVVRGLFSWIWRTIDRFRQVSLNLIFLAVLAFLVAGWWASRPPPLPVDAALLIAPSGQLVEQRTARSPMAVLQGSDGIRQVLLRDVVEAIRFATTDSHIKALVIEVDGLAGAGLSKLEEIAAAVADFRQAGKKVYAHGKNFSQLQYHLGAQADEVYLSPDGYVLLTGLGRYPTYFKGLFDQVGVRMQVFRVGTYKSFVEPYTRSDMSEEDRQATRLYLDAAWQAFQADILKVRPQAAPHLARYTADASAVLAESAGDAARMALAAGLVDGLKTADQWRDFLKEKIGPSDDGKHYKHVDMATYVAHKRGALPDHAAQVGILVAQGAIADGEQPSGVVGGDTLAGLIRQAREDDNVKAVVLRVDSPGGSATASEVIRRELELTRQAGKPVVVSMSSVAASGGYWIAMGADEVWASPTTLTGSIGIFAMMPDLSGPMSRLGLAVDGVGTTPLANGIDPRRPLDPQVASLLQQSIEHGYRRFLELVAQGRKMDLAAVDQVAQGRVWLGSQAKEQGLVDHLGGLEAAIRAAAARAKLTEYSVSYVEKPLSPRDQLLSRLLDNGESGENARLRPSLVEQSLDRLKAELQALSLWNDPGQAYLHCLCEAP